MEDIVCRNCGLINEYTAVMKSGQNVATCNGCGKHIKNIPQHNTKPMFHFGKYKGSIIEDVEDLSYLQWANDNVKLSPYAKEAVRSRITTLKLTHR